MSEEEKTIWCGNLSDKVTDDVLYELFLQAGPLDRIHIPKDRDGKQRTYAFITYKHQASVRYAIELFDGTSLFNRVIILNIKSRSNEMPPEMNSTEQTFHQNDLIQFGRQMLQCIPNPSLIYGNFPNPPMLMQTNPYVPAQLFYNEERRPQANFIGHPYQREPERQKPRYGNDHGRDNRRDNYSSSHRNRDSHYSHRHENSNRHDGGSRQESSSRHESNNRHENNRRDRRYYRS